MTRDKKVLYVSSIALVLILLCALFIPGNVGRTITALFLLASAITIFFLVKKRSILSIHKKTVLWIMLAMGAMCLVIYYLTGIHFGFYKSIIKLTVGGYVKILLQVAAIIGATEFIRTILVAQEAKFVGVFAYLVGVLSELLLFGGISQVNGFSDFLDVVGLTFFPALVSNLLYNYLAKRYGMLPSAVFRFILALPLYLIPIVPALDEAIYSFFLMIIPVFAWLFVDLLYEKKKKYAIRKGGTASLISISVMIVIMVSVIMLISGEFRYKLVVIATESMTGSINKGDALIYEDYDGQKIEEGAVVVFTKNNKDLIIHRVVDIQYKNGTAYYTTKGDANKIADSGYITVENLRGVVLYRLPNVGQPTLFLRDLFN